MHGVTRLDPAAVTAAPLVPEGATMSRTASLFEPGLGLSAGVWDADPSTETIDSYPFDEVCVVLEGTIELRHADGVIESYGPGEAFGTACVWQQPDRVRTFSVIRER